MPRFIAILDTMWGAKGRAPKCFFINPNNASGRRLYKLTQAPASHLIIVNSCREQVGHANAHGTPDPEWLLESLRSVPSLYRSGVLLVCGAVAQKTFAQITEHWRGRVVQMPHPAARTWTKEQIAEMQRHIAKVARTPDIRGI